MATATNEHNIPVISDALGLGEKQSDFQYIRRSFNLAGDSSKARRRRALVLNSLRLDAECFEYLVDQWSAIEPESRSTMLFLRRTILIATGDDESSPNMTNGLDALQKHLSTLVKVLSEGTLETIRVFDRSDAQRLSPAQLVALLRSFQHATKAKSICLNSMDLQGNDNLGPALQDMILQSGESCGGLTELHINRCTIERSVLKHFCSAFSVLQSLSTFSMQDCILDHDMQHILIDALIPCSADRVELRQCFPYQPTSGNKASTLAIITRLLREKRNMTLLNLSNNAALLNRNAASQSEIQAFAEALAAAPSLHTLKFRLCRPMSGNIVIHMFQALEHNPRIQELDLLWCGFTTLEWMASLANIQGLRVLYVPHDLRSPRATAALQTALKTNTSLGMISGEGRWRGVGSHVQRLLTRNQLLSTALTEQAFNTRLWPQYLTLLSSNTTTTTVIGSDAVEREQLVFEMSPVFAFLRANFAHALDLR